MNDNAVLYTENSGVQKTITINILEKYSNLINWQEMENVLDVGSGDGSVTSQILLSKLPKTLQKLVGIDISEKMVSFAKNTFTDNPKLDFIHLDIATATIPLEFHQHFDHIFTFFCLHWIPEDKHLQALNNMYDMLKPGGQVFMIVVSYSPIYDFWENMADDVKWASYMTRVKEHTPLYQHLDEPQKKLEFFLKQAAFEIQLCQLEPDTCSLSNLQEFRKWSEALDPYIKDIPKTQIDDYFEEYLKQARKHKMITIEPCDDEERIQIRYTVIVACAMKPL